MDEDDFFDPNIRFFNVPDVRLIGQTKLDYEEIEKFGDDRGFSMHSDGGSDVDVLPEIGGRLCYLSFNKRRPPNPGMTVNETYLEHIREVGHGSVIEHSVFHFLITDVSRNYTHEQVRHRVGVAYSQLSSRYVDQFDPRYFRESPKTLGAYMPPEIKEDEELKEYYERAWATCAQSYLRTYEKLKMSGYELKRARSIAREILPGSAGTMILVTVNARELNHIFKMRGALPADDQIRRVALCMFDLVRSNALFKYWYKDVTEDGRFYLKEC